jgi:hypothetical protein
VRNHFAGRYGDLVARSLLFALLLGASGGLLSAGGRATVSAQDGANEEQAAPEQAGPVVAGTVGNAMVIVADELAYRDAPGLDGAVLATFTYGTSGMITDGPVANDGYTWYEFSSGDYAAGWLAGEFLAPMTGNDGGFVAGDDVAVTGDDLHLRAEPSLSGAIVAALPDGTRLTITGGPLAVDGHTWYEISAPAQGNSGWVAGEFLVPSADPGAFALGDDGVVSGDGLNLRDAPTLDGGPVEQLADGTRVLITGGPIAADGYNWYRITVYDGADTSGWVAGEFLAYP